MHENELHSTIIILIPFVMLQYILYSKIFFVFFYYLIWILHKMDELYDSSLLFIGIYVYTVNLLTKFETARKITNS